MQLDVVVAKYIQLRDKKSELKKAYEEKVAAVDAALVAAEAAIMAAFNASGQTSARTPNGTAYVQVRTSCSVNDWEPFLEFVKAGEHWTMLERRASKSAVEQFREENQALPPGLKWSEERVINVRRS